MPEMITSEDTHAANGMASDEIEVRRAVWTHELGTRGVDNLLREIRSRG